jgi:GNAT superfamily N-acetyltransferase
VRIWAARDEVDQPVSAVWIVRVGSILGVTEMMTPKGFRGRGAGRALLTAALARSWNDTITHAFLLSTPAGRRLYESLNFVAVDESLTCFRGSDEDVLAAIG